MQISNITESGANNILKWAIANNANFKNDTPLQSIINDETFYLVTFSDVNFFELFRLTQIYRTKIRIINEDKADVPSMESLSKMFPGSYDVDDQGTKASLCEAAEHSMKSYLNMVIQMSTDDDIIRSSACRLFLPMMTRKFKVQIPISFYDVIGSLTEEEIKDIFTSEYPATLVPNIIDKEINSFKTMVSCAFVKSTAPIRYDKRFNNYLNTTKYFPLKNVKNNKLYKIGLLGFAKNDLISKGEIRCDMFSPNVSEMGKTLKKLAAVNSPLEIDFVIQLPIQYMQILQNSYDETVLPISYESCIADIISTGMTYDDFITMEKSDDMTEEELQTYEEHTNKIDAYKVRITEADTTTMNVVSLILNSSEDIDVTGAFSLLPSIYTTKAVVRLNLEHLAKYKSHYDPIIQEMFSDMLNIASGVSNDIQK